MELSPGSNLRYGTAAPDSCRRWRTVKMTHLRSGLSRTTAITPSRNSFASAPRRDPAGGTLIGHLHSLGRCARSEQAAIDRHGLRRTMAPMHDWIWLLAIYAVMSAVSFGAMALDKYKAGARAWRIPEKTLHTLEMLGGWPGSLLAMRLIRHKSSKPAYYLVTWGIAAAHAVVLALLLWPGDTK